MIESESSVAIFGLHPVGGVANTLGESANSCSTLFHRFETELSVPRLSRKLLVDHYGLLPEL